VARPHFRVRPRAGTAQISYDPTAVAARYGFPAGLTGINQTVALIELGGGYDPAQMSAYFAAKDIKRTGTLEAVAVDGVQNTPQGNPDGADGEVQLDIEVAGSVAPAANLAVYFGNNAGNGFLNAVAAAVHDAQRSPAVISISWGGPETAWAAQDLDAMDQAFQSAASIGITVCVASGDNGASDGEAAGTLTVDFPASSPHVLGCGGTSLPRKGAETAWNDGAQGGASGGGYSTHFNRPDWQSGNLKTGRGVPDVAGNADPATGYNVAVDAHDTVIGGTSAVAPLWAGLVALVNESTGSKAGFVNPVLYANPSALTDVVSGNNNGFQCGPGWDPVTGLGTPKGGAVLAALKGRTVTS
jgi:kumamolisin